MTTDDLLAELAGVGLPPHLALDYTMRMIEWTLKGAAKRVTLERKNRLFQAHAHESFTRSKRLPSLQKLLDQLDPKPRRAMSAKEIRAEVFAMAKAMGAKVIRRKKPKV